MLHSTRSMASGVVTGMVALLLAFGAVFGGMGDVPAHARSSSCTAWKSLYDKRGILPDLYKGNARCSSLQSNYKARASLDLAVDLDVHSSWFTKLNTTHSTPARAMNVRDAYYTVRRV